MAFVNVYCESKMITENIVRWSRRPEGSFILRPHAVYGPGDTTTFPGRADFTVKVPFVAQWRKFLGKESNRFPISRMHPHGDYSKIQSWVE